MPTKPLYGKILVTRSFPNRKDAEDFAKEYKAEYKQADISIKSDINRTPDSQWTATLYEKL